MHWNGLPKNTRFAGRSGRLTGRIPTVIQTDGPYVMWSGTPYVHLMVPLTARPEQRKTPSQ